MSIVPVVIKPVDPSTVKTAPIAMGFAPLKPRSRKTQVPVISASLPCAGQRNPLLVKSTAVVPGVDPAKFDETVMFARSPAGCLQAECIEQCKNRSRAFR